MSVKFVETNDTQPMTPITLIDGSLSAALFQSSTLDYQHLTDPSQQQSWRLCEQTLPMSLLIDLWSHAVTQLKPWYRKVIWLEQQQRSLRQRYLNKLQGLYCHEVHYIGEYRRLPQQKRNLALEIELDRLRFEMHGLKNQLKHRHSVLQDHRHQQWGSLSEQLQRESLAAITVLNRANENQPETDRDTSDHASIDDLECVVMDWGFQPLSILHQLYQMQQCIDCTPRLLIDAPKLSAEQWPEMIASYLQHPSFFESNRSHNTLHYISDQIDSSVKDFFDQHLDLVPSGLSLQITQIDPGVMREVDEDNYGLTVRVVSRSLLHGRGVAESLPLIDMVSHQNQSTQTELSSAQLFAHCESRSVAGCHHSTGSALNLNY